MMAEIEAARRQVARQQADLRKREEKFRRIVQTTDEGFILMDENLRIVEANAVYCRMLGYSREEIKVQKR